MKRFGRRRSAWSWGLVLAASGWWIGGQAWAQLGACCLRDGACVNTDASGCLTLTGDFLPAGVCDEVSCTGACCTANKGCFESTRDLCATATGNYQGPETRCEAHCPGAVSTSIRYQGQLKESSVPYNGRADLLVRLLDQAVEGTDAAPEVLVSAVEVVNGLFSVDLDFGVEAFNGNGRWLEVAVRAPHDPNDTEPFTVLAPRQPVMAAPYALALPGMRTTPSPSSPSVIGGSKANSTSGLNGATIAGGGAPGAANTVTDMFGTVSGGASNRAGNDNAFINDRMFATIGGGELNVASGAHATVPGGQSNSASGDFSFAAGRNATASHLGTFVWNSAATPFDSVKQQSFVINASGGVGIGTANPTAKLEIGGAAGTDGVKFPDATVQTTAYRRLKLSAVFDPPSVAAGESTTITISVPGAAVGDVAVFNPRVGLPTGLVIARVIVGTNDVTVTLHNTSNNTLNGGSNTGDVVVFK